MNIVLLDRKQRLKRSRKTDLPTRHFAENGIRRWSGKISRTWQNKQSDCAPSEDSDQPGHSPSVVIVFAVRMRKAWTLNYRLSAQRRLWSDYADAQADLSLRWSHSHFVVFVVMWLKLRCPVTSSRKWMDPLGILLHLSISCRKLATLCGLYLVGVCFLL